MPNPTSRDDITSSLTAQVRELTECAAVASGCPYECLLALDGVVAALEAAGWRTRAASVVVGEVVAERVVEGEGGEREPYPFAAERLKGLDARQQRRRDLFEDDEP